MCISVRAQRHVQAETRPGRRAKFGGRETRIPIHSGRPFHEICLDYICFNYEAQFLKFCFNYSQNKLRRLWGEIPFREDQKKWPGARAPLRTFMTESPFLSPGCFASMNIAVVKEETKI